MIEFIENTRFEILTPNGFEDFSGLRKTTKSEVVRLSLSNGKSVESSLDHLFIIDDTEVLAKDIEEGCVISKDISVLRSITKKGSFTLYDPVDVGDKHHFIADSITSHNCNFNSSGTSVFINESLEYIDSMQIKEPLERRGRDANYWIFEHPDYTKDYVVVADVARGDGKDYSAFHILDLENNIQVAEYKGQIPTKDYGHLLVEAATYYNKALLVVENASIGWSTLQTIQEIGYQNLYYTPRGEATIDSYYDPYADQSASTLGFTMSSRTRPMIVSKLAEYIDEKAVTIQSKRTLSELRVFIWNKGKAEAQKGYNDDLVMSLGIGMFIRDTALRYRQRGIDITKSALSNITVNRTAYQGGYGRNYNNVPNPYEIDLGDGNSENINWLL